ncbi:mitochondrial fission process protein 1 [Willisornis vidua]|uniref:Mitochondrial fission process protein 1 n=1 Tax=Willisornis vidua TaxID=1566151 RepID=A0ABQ9D510_9PASS|nr:mitochondrial fission process protein 1 [Willisornis vidua]
METGWDDSHDWSAAMDDYMLFWRDRQGKRGGGVNLYVRESLDSVELRACVYKVETLWIRIRGKANKADVLVGVSCRPPNQDDEVDGFFYKQLADVSKLPALVLVSDFYLLDICWELNTAEKRQSRRFLERMVDNFLLQLINEPTRGGTPLDLLFTNRDGLD